MKSHNSAGNRPRAQDRQQRALDRKLATNGKGIARADRSRLPDRLSLPLDQFTEVDGAYVYATSV